MTLGAAILIIFAVLLGLFGLACFGNDGNWLAGIIIIIIAFNLGELATHTCS